MSIKVRNYKMEKRLCDYRSKCGRCIKNIDFEDCEFIDVEFGEVFIINCTFKNCKFIRCIHGDSNIKNNKFIDCYFEDISFFNNLTFTYNLFDRVKGNICCYHANECDGNIFKDMDFTGFLPFYIKPDKDIIWRKNYFINTTVSLDALKKISDNVNKICDSNVSPKYLRVCMGEECQFDPYSFSFDKTAYNYIENTPRVVEIEGEIIHGVKIDLTQASRISKLNIVASVFTKNQICDAVIASDNNGYVDKSFLDYYTIPNPRPIRIVDNRGYVLNDGVIKNMNFSLDDLENFVCDVSKLKNLSYTSNNDLENLDNYSCKSLIKVK